MIDVWPLQTNGCLSVGTRNWTRVIICNCMRLTERETLSVFSAHTHTHTHTHTPDIRDTVNYKEVMKQYGLGPNGGIVTSLNLFATRFDQVMGFIEKRAPECK